MIFNSAVGRVWETTILNVQVAGLVCIPSGSLPFAFGLLFPSFCSGLTSRILRHVLRVVKGTAGLCAAFDMV